MFYQTTAIAVIAYSNALHWLQEEQNLTKIYPLYFSKYLRSAFYWPANSVWLTAEHACPTLSNSTLEEPA